MLDLDCIRLTKHIWLRHYSCISTANTILPNSSPLRTIAFFLATLKNYSLHDRVIASQDKR